MNCFNIREIQTLLRSRYHPDRWDSNSHHEFLHETALGLRLKLSNLSTISPNMLMSFEYGLLSSGNTRDQSYFYKLEDSSTSSSYFLISSFSAMLRDKVLSTLYSYQTPFSSLNYSTSSTYLGVFSLNWSVFGDNWTLISSSKALFSGLFSPRYGFKLSKVYGIWDISLLC
jgi:hypothetical protein